MTGPGISIRSDFQRSRHMKLTPILTTFTILLFTASITLAADPWKPAKGPLMTRWAKDVSPEISHPEYPRPQMVRKEWQNLNGLWQFQPATENEEAPLGKD